MKEQLKPPGAILNELISARSEELARVQKLQSEASKAIEIRGKAQLATLKKTLPKDWIAVLDSLDKIQEDASVATHARLKEVSSKSVASRSLLPSAAPQRPGPAGSLPVAPGTLGFFPTYMVLYDNGTIVNQGAPFFIDSSPGVSGSGLGLYGVDSFFENMVIDWWFQYSVPAATSYNHAIYVPFDNQTYTVVADDGFWTSKAARVSLNLQAQGFQSSTGAIVRSNVLDVNEQNVDFENVEIPNNQSMSYYELLDAGEAYLRVSALYYMSARGSGSLALFDLVNLDDNPNVPSLYIE